MAVSPDSNTRDLNKEDVSADIPEELQDEFAKAKIIIAGGFLGLVGAVVAGVAIGVIPATNEVAKTAVPLFTYIAGIVTTFFFKGKSIINALR